MDLLSSLQARDEPIDLVSLSCTQRKPTAPHCCASMYAATTGQRLSVSTQWVTGHEFQALTQVSAVRRLLQEEPRGNEGRMLFPVYQALETASVSLPSSDSLEPVADVMILCKGVGMG